MSTQTLTRIISETPIKMLKRSLQNTPVNVPSKPLSKYVIPSKRNDNPNPILTVYVNKSQYNDIKDIIDKIEELSKYQRDLPNHIEKMKQLIDLINNHVTEINNILGNYGYSLNDEYESIINVIESINMTYNFNNIENTINQLYSIMNIIDDSLDTCRELMTNIKPLFVILNDIMGYSILCVKKINDDSWDNIDINFNIQCICDKQVQMIDQIGYNNLRNDMIKLENEYTDNLDNVLSYVSIIEKIILRLHSVEKYMIHMSN